MNEIFKKYISYDVNHNLQKVKWFSNKKILKKTEELHLNLKSVYNAEIDWKKINSNTYFNDHDYVSLQ